MPHYKASIGSMRKYVRANSAHHAIQERETTSDSGKEMKQFSCRSAVLCLQQVECLIQLVVGIRRRQWLAIVHW